MRASRFDTGLSFAWPRKLATSQCMPLETSTTICRSLGSRTDMKSPGTSPSLTLGVPTMHAERIAEFHKPDGKFGSLAVEPSLKVPAGVRPGPKSHLRPRLAVTAR